MPNFKETQEFSIDIAAKIAMMSADTEIYHALNLKIPMNVDDPNLSGIPSIKGSDGNTLFDTEFLKKAVYNAIQQRDYKLAPNALNLQQAVKNVLEKNPIITPVMRPKDTMPDIPSERILQALATDSDNETTTPTGTPILPRRNKEFARTLSYEPVKPKPQEK